jgi:HD-like signal output (HDOD) protein
MTEQAAVATIGPEASAETYRSLCRLPVFRPVALKLLKTLALGEPDVREVTRLLEADPGLSAEVMTLANSALYGSKTPVRTIARAVTVLGLERMQSIALTVAMQSFTRALGDNEESRSTWRHSLGCAFAAEELAGAYGASREAGYMAGLMHDLGRFGLMAAYPCLAAGSFSAAYENSAHVLAVERQLFGMDHAEAGACLTQVWGLPAEFQTVAGRHHDDAAAADTGVAGLVRAACMTADAVGYEAVRKVAAPGVDEIVAGLPERVAAAVARLDLPGAVSRRFESLGASLEP